MWESAARYCPHCAAPMRDAEVTGRLRRRCESCRFVLYLNPASAAAALVVDDGKILLVRRGIEPFKGLWGLPAGYQEYDESASEAVVRETREETGLEVEIVRLYDVLFTRDDPRKKANLVAYLCRPSGGVLCAGDDATEARYFESDRLPEDIAFANNRILLARWCADASAQRLR
jgi:8-oxo-dGTP diphosphatase